MNWRYMTDDYEDGGVSLRGRTIERDAPPGFTSILLLSNFPPGTPEGDEADRLAAFLVRVLNASWPPVTERGPAQEGGGA